MLEFLPEMEKFTLREKILLYTKLRRSLNLLINPFGPMASLQNKLLNDYSMEILLLKN